MHWIGYFFTRLFFESFRLVPFRLLYLKADFMAWLLRVAGYRKGVIFNNLRRCFPEKTAAEIRQIARDAYRNLADVTLETIKGATVPLREINRRIRYRNYEAINRHLDAGQSVMISGAHVCNWEWAALSIAGGFHGSCIGVFKPMTNRLVDAWMHRVRERDGRMKMVPMKATFAAVEQHKNDPAAFLLVADQSPSNRRTAHWVSFFGIETACLPGVEAIARANGFPVFHFHMVRTARGFYDLSFHEICPDPMPLPTGAVTQLVMKFVEQKIRERPGEWLWSHRRWKMVKN